jgi:hypothetical protein
VGRYYFELDNGQRSYRDPMGAEADDIEEVRQAAISALPELAEALAGDHRVCRAVVRDASGRVVFTATLALDVGFVGGPSRH